jgi:hypothetical protein
MVETTEATSEGVSTRSGAAATGLPPIHTDISEGDDSDDAISEPDKDFASQSTDDTQVVTDLNVQGSMALYDDTRCLIKLSQRVKGHDILCGHPCDSCPRRKHLELQKVSGRRGQEGYYQQLPNTKGTINDAVADSFLTPQAWVEMRQSNRIMLTKLGQEQSEGKAKMEESLKTRSQPVVRIDTTPRGPRAQQLQAWAAPMPMPPQPSRPAQSPVNVPPSTPIQAVPPSPPVVTTVSSPQSAAKVIKPIAQATAATPTVVPLGTVPLVQPKVNVPVTAPQLPMVASVAPLVVLKPAPTPTLPSLQTAPPPQAITAKAAPVSATPQSGAAPGSDPALVAMLSRLVDRVEALNLSQQTVLTSNGQIMQRLADQTIELESNRVEMDRLRKQKAAPPTPVGILPPEPPVAPVSVPMSTGGSHNKYYAVAKGRQVGVFTRWRDTERSVHGYSGAIHKRFHSERAAREWLNARRGSSRPDDASEVSDDVTQREGTVYGDASRPNLTGCAGLLRLWIPATRVRTLP